MTPPTQETVIAQISDAAKKRRAKAESAAKAAERAPEELADAEPDGREKLFYRPHNLHIACERTIEVLAKTPNVFERAGKLVRVAGTAELGGTPTASKGVLERHTQDEDDLEALRRTPRVIPFTASTMRAKLASRLVVYEVGTGPNGGEAWVPSRMPDDLVKAVVDAGAWAGIHTLEGLSETAFLRPDGTVATVAGFDRTTGYYLSPSSAFLDVPSEPTQAEAAAALLELEEPFEEFPHVSRAHRLVAVSAILTLLARPAVRGSVPAHIFDAATRGSGKSLQSDVVSIIATGRASSKMSWPPNQEELEKVLGAYALQGAVLVNFDNVATGFGGAALDRCLTAGDRVELRVLGKSEAPSMPWRAVVLASGNNVVLVGDMSRRVLMSRVESPLENPEDRTDWRHPDLLSWVHENRARLVRAALVILRGFVVAGRPSQGLRSWGSFEPWSALVPPAIVWAGGVDVMACRPEVAGRVDPEKAALFSVLEFWPRLAGTEGTTAKRALGVLYPGDRRNAPPDGFEDLREALESVTNAKPGFPPSAVSVGKFLQKVCGRVASGKRLARRNDRKGLAFWTVEGAPSP
jgi:hypothetical protein